MLFIKKIGSDHFKSQEVVCSDHIDAANRRIRCAFGLPFVILLIAAIGCLIMDVMFVMGTVKDASFDYVLEPWTPPQESDL